MDIKGIEKFGIQEALIKEYIDKAKSGEYIVALLGEFSSGKSTFINAYLNEKDFLPNSNVECTPVLIDIFKSNKNKMALKFNNGDEKEIELSKENISKYAIYDREKKNNELVSIHLELNNSEIQGGYHLVDTPGMNTIHKEHEYVTKSIMRKADIVIYMINKELTAVDLEKLDEIKKYTKEILFVISHMDEEVKGCWQDRDKEDIKGFVELAEKTLLENGFESIVLPIGSYSAYKNRDMIDKIKNTIHSVLRDGTEKEFKDRIKNQVELIFEMRLKELKEEYELSEKIIGVEKDKCQFNIEKVERKLNNIEKEVKWDIDKVENYNKKIEEDLSKDIMKIYNRAKLEAGKKIEKDIENLEEEDVLQLIEEFEKDINKEFKILVEEKVKEILSALYKEVNEQIKDVYKDINIKIDSEIEVPTIEEFDVNKDKDLIKIKEEKEELIDKEAVSMDVINVHNANVNAIKNDAIKIEEKINAVHERMSKNRYIPEYIETEEEGGGNKGAMIGRTIGEIVDMAMFVWAPQGAALKIADKLKDGTKVIGYIGKGIEQADKVNKVCKKRKGYGVVECIDILSAGGIGERIGKRIGNSIVPYKKMRIENEEKKREWENSRDIINREKESLVRKEDEIREKIEEAEISRIQAIKERELLNRKRREIETWEMELRHKKEKIIEYNNKENIINHYKNELEKICEKEAKDTLKKTSEVILKVKSLILVQCNEEFQERIYILKSKINLLNTDRAKLEEEIGGKKILIEELNEYPKWVNQWI